MNKIDIPFNLIEKYFENSEELLFNINNCQIIKYENFDSDTFKKLNDDLLNSVSKKSIVYCIWVGENLNKLKPVYVGHAKHSVSRTRLINHLCSKNERTGAKLLKVKEALILKNFIGLTYIIVEPDFMRKSIEDWLIFKRNKELVWNTNN